MHGKVLLLSLALLTVALAGCSDDGDSGGDGTGTDTGTGTGTGTDTGTGGGEVSTEPVAGSCQVTVAFSAGQSGNYVASAMDDCLFTEAASDPTLYKSGLVEVTWDTLEPSITSIRVSLQSDGCNESGTNSCNIAETEGTEKPIPLSVTGGMLNQYGGDNMGVSIAAYGLAAQQSFTVHISLFETSSVPDGYSAVS